MCSNFNLPFGKKYSFIENLTVDFTYFKEIAACNYTLHIFIEICGLNGFPCAII